MPFDDDSFDTVVSTLVLCGVDDQPPARCGRSAVCCVPGGRLIFIEHVRSDDPKLARLLEQDESDQPVPGRPLRVQPPDA